MLATLRALLAQIVDYAGLFPPASLPLDQAIRNYARYRGEPDAWMLGRFICPAARLTELTPFAELFQGETPFAFSALGRGGNTTGEFLEKFGEDLQGISAFHQQHEAHVCVDALEVRLPTELVRGGSSAARAFFDEVARRSPVQLTVWYEAGFAGDWRRAMAEIIEAFKGRGGLKVRCGGQDAAAFPTVDQLAFAIIACRDAGVPLKFTAGLHHPIRHFDNGLQTKMHGFLNVFVTGVLAHACKLGEDAVRAILADEDAGRFVFTDEQCRWGDHAATPKQVLTARQELVTSFGSCSFDDPRDDLRALGLL